MHTGCVLRATLFICIFASTLGAVQLTDDANGFRVEIPDSLPKLRVDPARFPDTLYIFAEPERGGALLQFVLLPEEVRQPQGSPPRPPAGVTEVAMLWRGYTLMRRHRYFAAGAAGQALEITADIPVAKRGIRMALTGPLRRETELVGLFSFLLEHFEARSNWTINPSGPAVSTPLPTSPGAEPGESANSQPDATIGIAAMIALVLGFIGGWWLRGLGARPVPPPAELPKPEPAEPAPVAVPAAIKAFSAKGESKRPPDETDPGVVKPKCRVCGVELRAGKKVCMNCGSEVY